MLRHIEKFETIFSFSASYPRFLQKGYKHSNHCLHFIPLFSSEYISVFLQNFSHILFKTFHSYYSRCNAFHTMRDTYSEVMFAFIQNILLFYGKSLVNKKKFLIKFKFIEN